MPEEPQQQQTPNVDVTGTEAVSQALRDLLNTYSGLPSGMTVQFSSLNAKRGIGLFPSAGAVIQSERKDITGHVIQKCIYPFSILYRFSPRTENHRMRVKDLLDNIGLWLERQPVTVGNQTLQLGAYPQVYSGNRVIESITRTSPAFCNSATQDGIEDWLIAGSLVYRNEFDI